MTNGSAPHAERTRLANQRSGKEAWRLWGPYLADRAWGSVREDYSANGDAWDYFPHDEAHTRAFRWSEDGLGGICDEGQRLCFALALWNGNDPILKERPFGLTGTQGNRGEDVKEVYFYPDATPSHGYMRYLYKYPQAAYPYKNLIEENGRRDRHTPPYNLIDTGAFDEHRYWDVEVTYAKASPTRIHIRIEVSNRGPDSATLHLLPSLWFRNTWSWGDHKIKPQLKASDAPEGAAWAVTALHPDLGRYVLYGRQAAQLLFTENETNYAHIWRVSNLQPYVKDAFHRLLINGEADAVNPAHEGTKCAASYALTVPAGQSTRVELVLSAPPMDAPFADTEDVFNARRADADAFYQDLLPEATPEDHQIMRQALAGMVWGKQFFNYNVERWLEGDQLRPPASRWHGRNHQWEHMEAKDIISMPDTWEYPWFAAWDLAFHCGALALIDVDFAKDQIELMLGERYIHPNGQIPAYEWNFSDVNPPVHAMGALKVFRAERVQCGTADCDFLKRVFHKLLLNYAWWINRKDADGRNVFEGGFLGLDNISVFDRSKPMPPGYSLRQSDATGWMAMFALNMTVMGLELTLVDPTYEDMAIQTYEQFLAIAHAIGGHAEGIPLWDADAGFFKDLIVTPDGKYHHIDVYSMVGLIPLFATEVIDQRLLANAPRFASMLRKHKGGLFRGRSVTACPDWENARGEHLLALVDDSMLRRIMARLLNEDEFLSDYGVRSVSRIHAVKQDLGVLPGIGRAMIEYVPGESTSPMFGGNSNWRGPIWLPVNYALIQAIEKFHRFLGDGYKVPVPCLDGRELNMNEVATLISERIAGIYRRGSNDRRPVYQGKTPFDEDPHWRDLLLFYEYFHAEKGIGLGAAHQTGWTGLVANLIMRRYHKDIPLFWSHQGAAPPTGG